MLERVSTILMGVEEGGDYAGNGTLPIRTIFVEKKTRNESNRHGEIFEDGEPVKISGYEIHMGETIRDGGRGFSKSVATMELADTQPIQKRMAAYTKCVRNLRPRRFRYGGDADGSS